MKLNSIFQDSLALVAGMLLTLAFAPFHIFPLAILSPALLLGVWLTTGKQRAFWRGWLFGIGLFSTGVYWIFISVHTYGNPSIFIALLITSLLIAVLALFPAFTGFLLNRFFPKNNFYKIVCAFPAIWVFLEWVRTWIFSGFPWLLVGYSQIHSPLKGYASILSVYGVSLIALISSGLLVAAMFEYKKNRRRFACYHLLLLAVIWLLGAELTFISWTKPAGEPVKVSLVQGNIAQQLKWSPDQVRPTLERYMELTQKHWDSSIIVWPESAVPLPLHYAMDFLTDIAAQAGSHQATLITGIPIKAADQDAYYNGVIALGNGEGIYTKHQLVPFGEYIPYKNIFGKLFDLLQVPMSDFIPGKQSQEPLIANGKKIAVFVCYEIAYPEQVLSRDGDIDILLTVSNDAWFGRSIAQAQHLEIAQMRALEMGRPVLFVANDGITAFINAAGRIQSSAPAHVTYVLTDNVQPTKGKTPWQRFATDLILPILILLLAIARWRRDDL